MVNKLFIGEIITVVWHVDDLKVSHKGPFEVTKFVQYLPMVCGYKRKLQRGNVRDHLGMDFDHS